MHTIKGNSFTTFHFNGDFSGDVIIKRFEGEPNEEEIRLPIVALDALFAERIRRAKIDELESMTDRELVMSAIGKF